MRRLIGQALRPVRRLVALAVALSVLAVVVLGAFAWRLAQGPLDLPFLAQRIEADFNRDGAPTRLEIGAASIAWDGWRTGYSPFEIRLSRVRAVEEGGLVRADLPDSVVSISYSALLLGQVRPRRVEVTGARLRLVRDAAGAFSLDLGSLGEGAGSPADERADRAADSVFDRFIAELAAASDSRSPVGALERISVRDARIQIEDAQLGAGWTLDRGEIEVTRRGGVLEFDVRATLALGSERVPARIHGSVRGQPARFEAVMTMLGIRPAVLARHAAALAPLAAIDATASLEIRVGGRTDGSGASLAAVLHLGAGALVADDGVRIAIAGADISAIAMPQVLRLERAVLRLAPPAGSARREGPILTVAGDARLQDGRWIGALRGNFDALAVADLGAYWPEGVVEGGRRWLVENLTAGMARNGRFTLDARAPENALGAIEVTALSGTMEAEDVTAHWLRPMPPVEGVRGTVEFGLNEVIVHARGGRLQGSRMEVADATLRFHSFDTGPGDADLAIRLGGPLPDLMTALRHPRLRLFDRMRTPIPEMSGQVQQARLYAAFPLLDRLTIEEIRMRSEARIVDLRVARAVLGRDLERASADVAVTMDGLRVQAQARLSDVPVRLDVEMDFRAGAPDQVVSRETLSARADVGQLRALGIDLTDWAEGVVVLDARKEARRNGSSRVTLRGDLRDARIAVAALGWQKPRGVAGAVEAALRMQGEAVQALDSLRFEAADAMIRARAGAFRQGLPERIEIQEAAIGASRFSGEIMAPGAQGPEWRASLRGPVIDLRAALADEPRGEDPRPPSAERPGTPFLFDWRFDRALLGEARAMTALTGHARLDAAGVLREAEAQARFGNGGVLARIVPDGPRRRLALTSDDGGGLLRMFGILTSVEGGRLQVDATFEHARPGAPLVGQAELSNFAVLNAPALGKLLQAMTLFGMIEALSGPGLSFVQMVAPFRLTPDALELDDARAFSASLGLTARGRIDRRRNQVDMQGTIVPAYMFNQILGNIPILGRLFSPEVGGGLFAATYRLRGPLADPDVSVNPLAALTPGFLRGIFHLGQEGQPSVSPEIQRQRAPTEPRQSLPWRRAPATAAEGPPQRGPPAH